LEPGRLHMGARGPTRHFGGETSLAEQLLDAAIRAALEIGPAARPALGIADGRFAADLAARRAAHLATRRSAVGDASSGAHTLAPGILIVESGGTPEFLRPQPIESLAELGETVVDTVDLFSRLGLAHLGDLAALDSADVLARFGYPGLHAHHLARGIDDRGPDADPPPEPVEVAIDLDGPVDRLEPLGFTAKTLADDRPTALARNGRVCTRLAVTAETDHGERDRRRWHRADGLDAAAMVERVRWQLAGWLSSGRPTAGVIRLHL